MSSSHPAPAAQQQMPFDMDELLSIKEMLAVVQRQRKLIAICMIAGLVLAIIYIFFAQPRFTATTSIMIDPRQQNMMSEMLGTRLPFQDNLIIDSQIELIQSGKLIEKAAERSGVLQVESPQDQGFLSSIKNSLLGPKDPKIEAVENDRMRQARINGFRSGLVVNRVRNTYVLDISYTSTNPEIASRRANLIADVYMEDELEAQYEASQRTNEWLKTRLNKLREDLNRAERAVEMYKEENNLIQTSERNLISDQQLAELNSRLIVARSETAQAEARYDRIKRILEDGDPNTITSDLLNSSVIVSLRGKYIELSRLAQEIRRKHGEEHQAYRSLQRQMEDIQQLILDEYGRIAESYKGEYEIARSKQDALQKDLEKVTDSTMVSRRSQIELRELQRRAESTRNLYTKMLDGFNEQTERQSVPAVHARIISYANTPLTPSWPKKDFILLIGLVLGAAAGVALAFVREQFDRFIWKVEELEAVTRRTCLGMLPKIAFDGSKLGGTSKKFPRIIDEELLKGPPRINLDGFAEITALLSKQTGVTTEIMRNIQLAIKVNKNDIQTAHEAKVISFVSARPGEGKSITSCFLARHLSKSGARVALIDCDFRRPSLTHWFLPNARIGFYEIASQLGANEDEALIDKLIDTICFEIDSKDHLSFIPAKGYNTSITNLNLVSSGQMHRLIQHLKRRFDVILIDLPPIINIVDARVVASSIDSFVFLAQWGKTDRELVKKALLRAPEVYDKCAGTLLTLVDTNKASTYGYYNYNYYYHR